MRKIQEEYIKVAYEVVEGKWGNGIDRRANLELAGYNYNWVQRLVNGIMYRQPSFKEKVKLRLARLWSIFKGDVR